MDIKDLKTAKFIRCSVTDIRKDLIHVLNWLACNYVVVVTRYNKSLGYLLPVIYDDIQVSYLLKSGKNIRLEDFRANVAVFISELLDTLDNGNYVNNYYRLQDGNSRNPYYFIPLREGDKLGLPVNKSDGSY